MEGHTLLGRLRNRIQRKSRRLRERFAYRMRPVVLRSKGYCPICERSATFVARDPWLRDHFKCTRCKSIPRQRALMAVLQDRFPHWRELAIHESSPCNGEMQRWFTAECPRYTPSQYFPNLPLGARSGAYRCENLEQLTFADGTFDLHVTQDVFEHLLHPSGAFAEIARTLKPGGAHIFTVPIVNRQGASRMRVEKNPDGTLSFLQDPLYHSNPIDSQGALVTIDWGFDIREHIKAATGLDTEIVRIDDLSRGIRAEYIEVFVTTKAR